MASDNRAIVGSRSNSLGKEEGERKEKRKFKQEVRSRKRKTEELSYRGLFTKSISQDFFAPLLFDSLGSFFLSLKRKL